MKTKFMLLVCFVLLGKLTSASAEDPIFRLGNKGGIFRMLKSDSLRNMENTSNNVVRIEGLVVTNWRNGEASEVTVACDQDSQTLFFKNTKLSEGLPLQLPIENFEACLSISRAISAIGTPAVYPVDQRKWVNQFDLVIDLSKNMVLGTTHILNPIN